MDITGERPVCQRCFEQLTPYTKSFHIYGTYGVPPTVDELQQIVANGQPVPFGDWSMRDALKNHYDPALVYRIAHSEDEILCVGQPRPDRSEVFYWTRRYKGRGRGKDRDAPLFCGLECALSFAALCWDAGMRIKKREGGQ